MKNLFPSTLLLFAVLLGRSAGNPPTPKTQDLASSAMAKTAKPAPKITTFLWFDDDAEEAIRFYGTVFGDANVREETRWGDGGPVPKGTLMTARFTLAGQEFMALNGGPMFEFNEAISLFVSCETQAEIDRLWTKLIAGGGEPSQCGWLKDKYGLSWQIAPTVLGQMLQDEDAAKVARVTAAFMQMTKFDIAALQRAYDGR
jgi:predicted 3-demethylubiquinone-9 3-methyltransferase (glyoxalase superfamily)